MDQNCNEDSSYRKASLENSDLELNSQSSQRSLAKVGSKNWFYRKINFFVFLYICIFMNYDSGVIPSAASLIQDDLKLDFSELAALGTFVNFGIGFACLFVSFMFYKYPVKWVLVIALLFNSGFCILFAFSFNLYTLYFTRILMGITQAFWIVYGPVWINNFSPDEFQTTWIGIFQGFSPLGTIIGYGATALIVNLSTSSYSWRYSIMVQAFGQILPLFVFFLMDNNELDVVRTDQIERSGRNELNFGSLSEIADKIGMLFSNNIYVFGSLGLCVEFFVIYGIQFWGTTYLEKELNFEKFMAQIIFVVVTVTAPVSGLLIGGLYSDKMGGYKGDNMGFAINSSFILSFITLCFGVIICFVSNPYMFILLLWFSICCGAMCLPPSIGVILACVPQEYQPLSQSISQIFFNIFGYFISPIFSGFVMDSFDDKVKGLYWGWRVNMLLFGLMTIAFLCLKKLYPKFREENPGLFQTSEAKQDLKNGTLNDSSSIDGRVN